MTRTMISVNVDRDDPVLLHDQVAAEILGELGAREGVAESTGFAAVSARIR
jgi:hypothetical protein